MIGSAEIVAAHLASRDCEEGDELAQMQDCGIDADAAYQFAETWAERNAAVMGAPAAAAFLFSGWLRGFECGVRAAHATDLRERVGK